MPVSKTINARVPILIWAVDADDKTVKQLENIAALPFVHHHVAAMPDAHVGMGATIGSVIATKDAVIPAAVGVDIGCGMMLQKTSIKKHQLSKNALEDAFSAILARTPVGLGQHSEAKAHYDRAEPFADRLASIVAKAPTILSPMKVMDWRRQLGTLGGGNHFIELTADENGDIWVMLHSGSRGVGNIMAGYFISEAKRLTFNRGVELADPALSYFEAGDALFDDYLEAAAWAQDYAAENRRTMMSDVFESISRVFKKLEPVGEAIDCHHNYVAKEAHFGESVYVTRKGAIRAGMGELGIVPGSMGAASYLVEGLGNPMSFCSSAHGAGRRYGRMEAKRRFTVADLERQTQGVVCRKDKGVLDEIPSAYKPIESVMNAQSDLTRIVHEFKQVLCVKG